MCGNQWDVFKCAASPSLLIWMARPTRPLSPQERLYLQIQSYDLPMTESLWIAPRPAAFFTSFLLSFFFLSPAASWISQEQQPHYQPKMYSSILLLSSDKGTARQVTRARGERGGEQHFSSCSAVLHVNGDWTAAGENHFWCTWWPRQLAVVSQRSERVFGEIKLQN